MSLIKSQISWRKQKKTKIKEKPELTIVDDSKTIKATFEAPGNLNMEAKMTTEKPEKQATVETKDDKPIQEPLEQPKRLMFKNLKQRTWPDAKNVKVKLMQILENNVLTFVEDIDEVVDFYTKLNTEINAYCEGLEKQNYFPV